MSSSLIRSISSLFYIRAKYASFGSLVKVLNGSRLQNLKRSKLFEVCEKRDEKLFDRYLKASTQLGLDVFC